jgi:hypothetical protein
LCEELVLRARVDFDQERVRHAAIELEHAYSAALAELPAEQRPDLAMRIGELRGLHTGVERAAEVAIGASEVLEGTGHALEEIDAQQLRNALERLEAALRARTAQGIRVK